MWHCFHLYHSTTFRVLTALCQNLVTTSKRVFLTVSQLPWWKIISVYSFMLWILCMCSSILRLQQADFPWSSDFSLPLLSLPVLWRSFPWNQQCCEDKVLWIRTLFFISHGHWKHWPWNVLLSSGGWDRQDRQVCLGIGIHPHPCFSSRGHLLSLYFMHRLEHIFRSSSRAS